MVYVLVPTNTRYKCQDYSAPIGCNETVSQCYSGSVTVYPFSAGGCIGQSVAGTLTLTMSQCPYDSCD